MEISKLDWIQWKNHPVTEKYMMDMLEQMDDIKMYLMKSAGKDSLEDRRLVGVVEGAQWLLDWQPNFIDEGEDTDGTSSTGTPAAY